MMRKRTERLSDWIPVNSENYDELQEIGMEPDVGGPEVEVSMFVSPYEIPRAVRGGYDEKLDRFVIEFRYISDEKFSLTDGGPPGVRARVGRESGRVLGFEIDVHSLGASSVSLRVVPQMMEAIDNTLQRLRRAPHPSEENSRIASKVLHDSRDEVFRCAEWGGR